MTTAAAPRPQAAPGEAAAALAERILGSAVAAMEIAAVHLGHRLGLYGALADGPCTPGELAARAGCDERYVREWLEHQAVAGIVEVDDVAAPPALRRYALPAGHDDVLVDADGPAYMAPMARLVVGVLRPIDALLQAFRSGAGVPYPDYGADTREGISDLNRPMFLGQLAQEWIPAAPEVHRRLLAAPGARVADLACGQGWSSIAIARAYPGVRVDAIDNDPESVARARANVAAEGLGGRVRALLGDAADPALRGPYDLVTIFEALHDMARPVEALTAARAALAPGGSVLVADERVAEAFTAPGDDIERLNYGFSVLHCLPVGRAEGPSACTGTVIRPHTVEAYAREAGFARVEVLPVEHDFWRFYRLSG